VQKTGGIQFNATC
jgi:uncharacterized protein